MNNYDLIRSKTLKELAEFIYYLIAGCDSCPCDKYDYPKCFDTKKSDCIKTIGSWLKKKGE